MFTEQDQPRRRRLWWWVLAPLVIILIGLALGAWGERNRSSVVGVEDLRDQTVVLGREAGSFRDLLLRLPDVTRTELEQTTTQISSTLTEVRDFIVQLDSEVPYRGETVVLKVAVDIWKQGVEALLQYLLQAADDPTAFGAADGISQSLLDIRSGDRLYQTYTIEMGKPELPQPVSPWTQVVFLPPDYPIDLAGPSLVNSALEEDGPLQAEAGLALGQINTDPEWLLDAQGGLVIIATDQISVSVVIENRGNVPSDPQVVSMDLSSLGDPIDARTTELVGLEPGEKTTVNFSELAVEPGITYQLGIRVGVVGSETISEDTARTIEFRINSELSTSTTSTTEIAPSP